MVQEKGALEDVNIPILMITGEKDTITPSFHGEFVLNGVSDKEKVQHIVVENGGHFSFLSPFPDFMKSPSFPLLRTRQALIARSFMRTCKTLY